MKECYNAYRCQRCVQLLPLLLLLAMMATVDGFRIGGIPALQQQHRRALPLRRRRRRRAPIYSTYNSGGRSSENDSNNYSVGGGGQEGFHYLSTDVPPYFRNSLQGDGPDGHRVRSRASFAGEGEKLLDFIYNNHSEAAQIQAAQERMLEPLHTAEAVAKLTPPLLGPPQEVPQQLALPPPTQPTAQEIQQQIDQQQEQQTVPASDQAGAYEQSVTAAAEATYMGASHQAQPPNAAEAWGQAADSDTPQALAGAGAEANPAESYMGAHAPPADPAGALGQPAATGTGAEGTVAPATSTNNDAPKPPLSERLSWTPTALHKQPLWHDLQSEPQRNSQLQAELRRAFQELQHYHTLLLEYEQDLDTAAARETATATELAASHTQLAASQETIAQLRHEISALQQKVHDSKAVELEYVKREVAYLQHQEGEANAAAAAMASQQDAVLTQLRADMAVLQQHVQESKALELAHAKEQHQRELEVVRQQGYQSAVNKVHHWGQRITKLENELQQLKTTTPAVVVGSAASGLPGSGATSSLPAALPQLPGAVQRPWSTMPGAKFNTDGVVYDSAYDDTRTTD